MTAQDGRKSSLNDLHSIVEERHAERNTHIHAPLEKSQNTDFTERSSKGISDRELFKRFWDVFVWRRVSREGTLKESSCQREVDDKVRKPNMWSPNARFHSLDIIPRLYRNLRNRNIFRRIHSQGKQLRDAFRQNNYFFLILRVLCIYIYIQSLCNLQRECYTYIQHKLICLAWVSMLRWSRSR